MSWREQANCLGAPTEIFFVGVGEVPKEAVDICKACKVQTECLEYVLTSKPRIQYGVWAGYTIKQLRQVRKERNHGKDMV